REQDRRDQLESSERGALLFAHDRAAVPAAVHGIRMLPPTRASARSMLPVARSIATGRRPPTPRWNGVSRAEMSRNSPTITIVTAPIIIACVPAPSSGSAKNSMYAKITAPIRKSTIHTDVGMTPRAPHQQHRGNAEAYRAGRNQDRPDQIHVALRQSLTRSRSRRGTATACVAASAWLADVLLD